MKLRLSHLSNLVPRFAIAGSIFMAAVFYASAANFALSFNGTGTGVTVTNNPAFDSLPLTVTFWVQTTQNNPAVSGLATKSPDPALLNGWQVFITNGQVRASYCVNPVRNVGGPNGIAGPLIADGHWHYVAFAVDTNSGRLFVDGVPSASALWTGVSGLTLNTNDVHLGSFAPPGTGLPFQGAMDEITVWNIALTPAQIASNMNIGLTGNEPGLIAYYRCNEGTGPTLLDSAPAAGTNNGLLDPSVTYIPSTIGSNAPAGPTAQTFGANVGPTNALLIGSMNPMGNSTAGWFQWGTTTNYGNSTGAYLDSGTSDVQFFIPISNLSGGTLYHYRAVASNSVGMAFGNDLTFTTPLFALVYTNLMPLAGGSVSWGDYDNDGLLDIFITGQDLSSGYLNNLVYRNTGTDFSNVFVTLSVVKPNQRSAWSDFDNDGRLDLLLIDYDAAGYGTVDIFRNTSTGFTNADTLETNFISVNATWVDFDDDGKPDVFLYGGRQVQPRNIAELWRNTGSGFQNLGLTFPQACYSAGDLRLAWGDYDGDGLPDLLISYSSRDSGGNYIGTTELWRNTGNGFSNVNTGLTGVFNGAIGWADYDGDGKLDIIITGETSAPSNNYSAPIGVVSQIWRNTGTGFSNINANLTPVYNSCVSWGDYDNDGKLDLILCGNINRSNAVTYVYRNMGTNFSLVVGLTPLFSGSVAWGDYDNDGRLDILLAGVTALDTNGLPMQAVSQVWRNFAPQTNSRPAAPTGLTVTPLGPAIRFAWNAASDAQTPAAGLTYNLRVGSTPGGGDLVNAEAAPTGQYHLAQPGNSQTRLSRSIPGLPIGKPLYWSVQAVDSAFAGSPFAAERSFEFSTVLTPLNGVPVPGDTNGDGIVDQNEFASVLAHLNGNGIVSDSELSLVLSNYWPYSPWLMITNPAGLGGSNVTFQINSNSIPTAFSVQYSTDLSNWFFLGPAIPGYSFTDTNAPAQPKRYYRLHYP